MVVNKKMYTKGKLTESARKKLQAKLDKENAKDTILSKFDRQCENKKTSWSNKKQKSKVVEPAKRPASVNKARVTMEAGAPVVDECPDTPPRNEMVRQRRAHEGSKDPNWISIVKHNQVGAIKEEKAVAELEEKSRNLVKGELDAQIHSRKIARDKAKQDKLEYNAKLREKFSKWDDEKKDKAKVVHEKAKKLKEVRQSQVEELNQRREKQEKRIRAREQKEVARLKAELEAEKLKQHAKKKKNLDKMTVVLEENKRHKAKLIAEEKRDADEAVALQKQYAEILKKQEEARNNRLANTYKLQEQKQVALADATAEERRAEARAQALAEKQRLEREKKLDETELAKQMKLKLDIQSCNDAIAKQIVDKQARIRQEIQDDRSYGAKLKAEADVAEAKEQKKHKVRKDKLLEQQTFLRGQVADNEKRRLAQRAEISDTEKLMNKKLLSKIADGVGEEAETEVDPKKPYAWRYTHRKCPF